MSEWKEDQLGSVLEVKYGKDHKALENGTIPCIGSGGIMRYVNKSLYDKVSILIPRKGSLNNIMYQDNPFWTVDTMFWSKINEERVNPKFLFYQLSLIDYTNLNVGSAVPSLTVPVINEIEILLPEKYEQNSIAEVLSSLDDKIDLLHRQNQTLEQMAETLFRQWFVENPNPDWEEKSLSSIATFLNGLACQKFPPKNEVDKLPVLKIKELRSGISDNCDWCTTEVDEKYIVKNGDIIFSWSASLMVKIWDGEKCILNQHLFKVTSDKYPKWFYYLWSKFHLQQFISIASAHATTMGHIKRGDLDEALVLIPSDEEIISFTDTLEPIIEKLIINNRQISNLVNLRDTLLPKLMNGEVRVADTPVIALKKTKETPPEFKEAILIAAIVRTLFTPKIGNVSRQWYQKIGYLHKRKLKELTEQQSVFELTTEYSKKAAGPYKKKMRYQGPEGICLKNRYMEAVNDYAFKPSEDIHKIDNYFDNYWNNDLFENWTMEKFRFIPVKKLGVYATVDYSLLELKKAGKELSASNVLDNISESKDWKHKKELPEFSPQNIEEAIDDLKNLYTY